MNFDLNEILAAMAQKGGPNGQDTVNSFNSFLQASNPYQANMVRTGGTLLPIPTNNLLSNAMFSATPAPQLQASSGINFNNIMPGAPKPVSQGPVEFSSAQKLAIQKAEEERKRKEMMNEWQSEWKKTQQIKDKELRDRLAEIRAQGLEQRKTQYEGYKQSSVLGKENKEMSAAQVYEQLMSALGGF